MLQVTKGQKELLKFDDLTLTCVAAWEVKEFWDFWQHLQQTVREALTMNTPSSFYMKSYNLNTYSSLNVASPFRFTKKKKMELL